VQLSGEGLLDLGSAGQVFLGLREEGNRLAGPLDPHSRRVSAAICLLAFEGVYAVDLLLVFVVGVVLDTLLVQGDSLAEELEALVGVALVLALIQIGGRVALQFLLDPDEVLLRVRANLSARPSLHVVLHPLPVFAVVLQSYQLSPTAYLPVTNFLCSSLVQRPAVLPIIWA